MSLTRKRMRGSKFLFKDPNFPEPHDDSLVKEKLCPFFPASVFSSIANQAIIPGIAAQKVEFD